MASLPRCKGCNKKFTASPSGVDEHTPLLLRCSHTFCKHCLIKWASGREKIICPICELSTPCRGKEGVQQLWPNICFAGLINCRSQGNEFSKYFADIHCDTSGNCHGGSEKLTPKCSECERVSATCRCIQCCVDMCSDCFLSVHAYSKLLQRHQKVPLRASLTDTKCIIHNRVLEFYCEEDKTAICPECVISPNHKSHDIIHMVGKYELMKPELQSWRNKAISALSHSTKTKSEIVAQLHKIKDAAYQQAELVNKLFLDHVSYLQASFLGMIRELHDHAEYASIELNSLLQEVDAKELPIKEACKDADLILLDEAKTQVIADPDKVIDMLKSCESLPSNLMLTKEEIDNSVEEEYHGEYEFVFEPSPEILGIKQKLGAMKIKTCLNYKLKTLAENPSVLNSTVGEVPQAKVKPANLKQMQEPYSKSQELIHVTYMDSPKDFRVRRFSDKVRMQLIERCLKVFKTRKPLYSELFSAISVGELCAAFYDATRCWYRARVVRKVHPDIESMEFKINVCVEVANDGVASETASMVEVLYIDFGDTAIVKVTSLRRLPEVVEGIPDLGISCCLNNICPADGVAWSDESLQYFAKILRDRPLLMTTVRCDDGLRMVDLHRPAADEIDADVPMSIRDAMVFLGYAKFQFTVNAPSLSNEVLNRKFLTPSQIAVGSLVSVVISNFKSVDRFLVQLTDSNMEYLAKLMRKIQIWVSKQSSGKSASAMKDAVHNLQIICPRKGMICLARFQLDRLWYRAQIVDVNSDCTVSVEYVDYGDTATIHFSDLLKIPEPFIRLPVQALPCKIYGVSPLANEDSFSDACCRRFMELCSHSELIMDVKASRGELYCIDLFDSTDEDPSIVSVSDRLNREGLLKLERFDNKTDLKPVLSCDKTSSEKLLEKENITKGDTRQKAVVQRVVSPDLFYVQTHAQTEELNKMMPMLQKAVEEKERDLEGENWKEELMCVIRSKIEKRWSRALVKSIENDICKVLLVDFGWYEMLPLRNLLKMPDQFVATQEYTIKCSLRSVKPAGGSEKWTSTAIDRFKEFICGEECLVERYSSDPMDVVPVDIWICNKQHGSADVGSDEPVHVATMLEMEGLALPVKSGCWPTSSIKHKENLASTSDNTLVPNEAIAIGSELPNKLEISASSDDVDDCTADPEVMSTTGAETSNLGSMDEKDGNDASTPMDTKIRCYTNVYTLPIGEQIPCIISHVNDHRTFVLRRRPIDEQLSSPVLSEIFEWNMMMKGVQDTEGSIIQMLKKADLVPGNPCLCFYVDDQKWHRGIILSAENAPDAVEVQYVDFGTIDCIPLRHLKKIPDALCDFPLQSYICYLLDGEKDLTSDHDEDKKLAFANALQERDLVAVIHSVELAPQDYMHYKSLYATTLYYMSESGMLENVL